MLELELHRLYRPFMLTINFYLFLEKSVTLFLADCKCDRLASVTWSIVAKRCVLEQKLLLTAIGSRIWEIDWYQNEWPWPSFRVCMYQSRSHQPLRYIWRWIGLSRKPLEIEAWFQRTTNRKWPIGYQMVTWPMTSRGPQRCFEALRSAILISC